MDVILERKRATPEIIPTDIHGLMASCQTIMHEEAHRQEERGEITNYLHIRLVTLDLDPPPGDDTTNIRGGQV